MKNVSNDDGTSVQMVNIHNNSSLSTSFITYETFIELVGPTVMNNLYSFQTGIEQDKSSQEFLILFKLWQEFQKNNVKDKSSEQSNSLTQTVESSEAGDSSVIRSPINQDTHTLNYNTLTFEDQNLICNRDVSNDGYKTITNTETFCDKNETLGAVLDLSLTYKKERTKAFHEFLEKPPILMRKGKKFTEKTSYALSSNEWKEHEMKKIEKQELKNKELKKIAASEKKKLAERQEALKKQIALQKKKEKQEFF